MAEFRHKSRGAFGGQSTAEAPQTTTAPHAYYRPSWLTIPSW